MKPNVPIIVGAIAAGLGLLIMAGPKQYRAWQHEHSLATTHITYSHFRCPDPACPAYQIDVYGDGTIIYQGLQGVAVTGAFIYHVPRDSLQAYLRDFRVSGFWQVPHAARPATGGGDCGITLVSDHHARRAGCLDLSGDDGMTLETPRLAADVAQLEAITHLDALVTGVPDIASGPIRGLRPYRIRPTHLAVAASPAKPVL